jgi:hypothetical protein
VLREVAALICQRDGVAFVLVEAAGVVPVDLQGDVVPFSACTA